MICRRRRNTVFLLLAICLVLTLFYYMKSSSFIILNNDTRDIHTLVNVKNAETLKELQRLQFIENNANEVELMQKYNDSLKVKNKDDPFLKDTSNYVDFENFKIDFKDTHYKAEDLRPIVGNLNERQITYNSDKFTVTGEHAVIVIQVHKRVEYFKELLDSLQHAKGIENTILVISHDYYSDKMNDLIRKIDFCQVIQIFFPYSLQLYPKEYPGQSQEDCPRDLPRDEALRSGCLNAEHPDKYGHYREAHITMTKHHWWWKINMVFDELGATKNHNGPFMFVEEDHFVTPSFLDALMKLHQIKNSDSRCVNACDILTLGNYSNKENFQLEGRNVFHGSWISNQHNMGMAFYRDTWEKIKKCSKNFCVYDDYNWDWTLMSLSNTCMDRPLTVLVYEVPRIFHIGDCGLHHGDNCENSKETMNKVKAIIKNQKDYLFQPNVNVIMQPLGAVGIVENGGWGDMRDHDLCQSFVRGNKDDLM